ncbi:hypothetical protein [Ramlibacter lithotrophicus]|uniref:hypothetical protein n=1 Tax=Ramlibacter lithotrophicus TaxID=2606681 RepID=UPI001EE2E7EC|nr:hypothetical protein [Ramlibacter lithotrophicus]
MAMQVLEISGANRELTEGVAALLAAAMLLYVGYLAERAGWQSFIKDQLTSALGKRTLGPWPTCPSWAVYRELVEIILFYQAPFR